MLISNILFHVYKIVYQDSVLVLFIPHETIHINTKTSKTNIVPLLKAKTRIA